MKLQKFAFYLLVPLMLAPVALPSLAQEKPGAGTKTPASVHDFKALMRKTADAWQSLDISKVAPFYAKDTGLLFFDFAPLKYSGWAEYAAGASVLLTEMYTAMKITLEDVQTHHHGNLAWGVATVYADAVTIEGFQESIAGRLTMVWEKRGNDWLIVHDHWSTPMEIPMEE